MYGLMFTILRISGRNKEDSARRVQTHAEVGARRVRPVRGEVRGPRHQSAGAGAGPRGGLPGAEALRPHRHSGGQRYLEILKNVWMDGCLFII